MNYKSNQPTDTNIDEWQEGYKDYTLGVYVVKWYLPNATRRYNAGWYKAQEDAKNGMIPIQENIRYIDIVEEV